MLVATKLQVVLIITVHDTCSGTKKMTPWMLWRLLVIFASVKVILELIETKTYDGQVKAAETMTKRNRTISCDIETGKCVPKFDRRLLH